MAEELKALTQSAALTADAAQLEVALGLDRILKALREARPAKKSSALGWMFGKRRGKPLAIRGLYVHGSVGRGKTMLMDMFFRKVPGTKKRRAHFHEFMADVHNRIHAHRQLLKNGETKQNDPVPPVASALFAEAEVLCFDEFAVTDITDAMILARLFTELFSLGCVLVATSNVAPENLYREGLNRSLFLPFIGLLENHVDVVTLDSPNDYRMQKLDSRPVYLTPLDAEAKAAMDAAWLRMTNGTDARADDIVTKGRKIHVPLAADRAARFTFNDLCAKPHAASDYLKIATRFDNVFMDNVPRLGPERRNEIKRFINLIDALYDNLVCIYITAEAMPEDLLIDARGTEGFEFDRTISRLFEMRSAEYLAAHRQKRQVS